MVQHPESRERGGKARHAREIARGQPGLAAAIRRAESYIALNRRLATLLPTEMRGRLGVACIEHDCMILAAATPELATRARLMSRELLTSANQWWPSPLTRSRIIVTPEIEFSRD